MIKQRSYWLGLALKGVLMMLLVKTSAFGQNASLPGEASALYYAARGEKAEFDKAVADAREKNVSEQTVLEAMMLRGLLVADPEEIQEILQKVASFDFSSWDYDKGQLVSSAEKLDGATSALKARSAYLAKDAKAFERHAKDAFWSDPDTGSLVGQWIKEERQNEKIKDMRLPMDLALKQSTGGETTLKSLVHGKKALLIDFWASWCGPCMRLMPELAKKSETLAPKEIIVVGMNTEDVQVAERIRKEHEISFPWLVEPENRPFSQMLGIGPIPRMVLVSAEGEVLYNGHPADPALKKALEQL